MKSTGHLALDWKRKFGGPQKNSDMAFGQSCFSSLILPCQGKRGVSEGGDSLLGCHFS